MQIREISLPGSNSTLKALILELNAECQNVNTLVSQLQLPDLNPTQEAEILAELLASAIHLQAHCSQEFQDLIAEQMENLPED
ncbi:hypothetical protein [Merismopedia glauca]|uniref:Uncharacterized protein n=1 Tax=Merismopedia glauca CCAP 1448/3 TaxID=1296344 RepID=A0A2T1C8P7_9CYAN|nr:hypothetical protein [Merismopedia glauca]PSB04640.1 hypothetical protein C7B64_02855 [Merismopedia glauca CCAP 1448/3]